MGRRILSWKEISDPIYGYVYFNREIEEKIINTLPLQRLRYILQLQTAHLVYPGAVHTRFQHSLGAMHLAGLMARDYADKLVHLSGEEALGGFDPETLVEAARLAGLLHDVGHGPFSHAFEEAILWGRAPPGLSNHELIGMAIVRDLLLPRIEEAESRLGLPGLSEALLKLLGRDEPREAALSVMRWTIKGSLYPADVLDFIRRDSYYAGTSEYGYIAYDKLVRNTYPVVEGGKAYAVLDRSALGELRAYFVARVNMYERVYYHPVCRAFERLLKDLLAAIDAELGLLGAVLSMSKGDYGPFLSLTDAKLYAYLLERTGRGDSVASMASSLLIERKPPWRRVGKEIVLGPHLGFEAVRAALNAALTADYALKASRELEDEIASRLSSRGVGRDDVWVDFFEVSPIPKDVLLSPGRSGWLKLRVGRVVGGEVEVADEIDLLTEVMPVEAVVRAYVRREKYSRDLEGLAARALEEAIEAVLGFKPGVEGVRAEEVQGAGVPEYMRITK
ncbi:MAG: HD domain-containing protein [Desulfurococcaceae archaeon]